MSVDLTAVRRIAHLARIAVSDAEVPHLQDEINAILTFVEALERGRRRGRRADDLGHSDAICRCARTSSPTAISRR